MSLLPFLVTPVLMEPSATASAGYAAGQAGSTGLSAVAAPFLYNGALYMVLQGVGLVSGFVPTGGIYVYTSLDEGATWAALDAAGGPSRVDATPIAGFLFDGDHSVIVAFSPDGGPLTAGAATVNLQNFDLDTGTWGAVYGTSAPPTVTRVGVNQLFLRPDSSLLLLTSRTVSGLSSVGLKAFTFTAGVWSAGLTVDSGLSGGFVSNGRSAAVMDTTGRVHVFGISRNGGAENLFYQAIETTNTLGTFVAAVDSGITGLPGATGDFEPAISGDNVLIGLVDATGIAYATLGIGTPLSAPVFTKLGTPGIDPAGPGSDVQRIDSPVIAVDATGIYAAYIVEQSIGLGIIRLCFNANVNTPAVGWDESILAYDQTTSGLTGLPQFLGIARDDGNLFAVMQDAEVLPGQGSQYWLGVFAPSPAAAAPFRLALYGYKRFKTRECAPDLAELPYVAPPRRVL